MEAPARGPRSLATLVVVLAAAALACAGFVALGAWQLQRLGWKEALIAQVESQLQAAPTPAPGPAQWAGLQPQDQYRRVAVRGRFDYARELLAGASTDFGAGYWVLTPLQTDAGWWLLVNRGFVPAGLRGQVPRGAAEQELSGLLRISEPGGGFLRANDPAAGRWYSRDVAAMAAAQGLAGSVAPYFVDAQAQPGAAPGWPRAGLTVVRFRNDHLVYALTWFALAAIMAAAIGYLLLDARRQRRLSRSASLADPHP
ncbi:SURF1 family protein [Ramlibacter monticola]|uniref:SURF1-like protein n=1 Tax=Ramlibacter monticola TaxID=1926872 RepID=A0A936Z5I1_9BURK|nr:SURF1 family protein [Ramlibacter monticola]MBL0394386.1 SURF1 family protein [Ramlibacter monticola]